MKKLLLGALAATLVTSCATTSDSPSSDDTALPPEAAAVPGEESGPLSNDPFLNSGAESTDPSALATAPTETPSAPPAEAPAAPPVTPDSPVAEAPPVPVAPQDLPKPVTDGDLASAAEQMRNNEGSGSSETPPTTSESGTTAEAAPAAPGADTPPPYTTSTTLDSTTQANNPQEPSSAAASTPPPVMEAQGGAEKRNYRQQYKEYQDRAQTSAQEAEDLEQRANFAHEGGAWQIGLDYDFTGVTAPAAATTGTITDTKSYGGALSWSYFPLRSIDTGRLGIGLRGGAYFSKYDTLNGTVKNTSSSKLSALTYGARATYELDYWIAQLLVPFVFLGYDQVSTKAFSGNGVSITGQKFGSMNYGAGLNFNLNRLEPRAASRSLVSTGIRKFYLSYTFQQRSGELTGASHFLGLRFEY